MQKIVLIDAYAHIYRLYYAMARSGRFTNPAGEPNGAVYGFARLLLQIENTLPSRYGAVAFDKGKAVKRTALLPDYKAQRPPMPDDLRRQVPTIRQWMEAFGWPILEEEGREADDIIAAVTARRNGFGVDILAFDKDIMQLVNDDVRLLAPGKNGAWTETARQQVIEKFGVEPEHVVAYLSLLGDSSDNIKGIDGIGSKTAAKLLNDFGSLDGLLAHLDDVKPERVRQSLCSEQDLLHRNVQLIRLDDGEPAGWRGLPSLERRSPDWSAIRRMAEAEAFKSLLPAIDKAVKQAAQPTLF